MFFFAAYNRPPLTDHSDSLRHDRPHTHVAGQRDIGNMCDLLIAVQLVGELEELESEHEKGKEYA